METAPSNVKRKIHRFHVPANAPAKAVPTQTGAAAIQKVFGRMKAIHAAKE